jgi:hypothetical protein
MKPMPLSSVQGTAGEIDQDELLNVGGMQAGEEVKLAKGSPIVRSRSFQGYMGSSRRRGIEGLPRLTLSNDDFIVIGREASRRYRSL